MKHLRASCPGKFTVFVLDAALVRPVAARLRLELDVAELQHGCHQLQHRLHFVLHKTHDLHGILGRENKTKQKKNECYQVRNVNPHRNGLSGFYLFFEYHHITKPLIQ